jgi:hypothetical protein
LRRVQDLSPLARLAEDGRVGSATLEGDNGAIKSTCKGHGATLVFDEKSHVHVEFANGVA